MEIGLFTFLLYALAVFRFTHLLVYDSITEGFRRLFVEYKEVRTEDGGVETIIVFKERGWKKWAGELVSCHWCMGIWTSAFLYGGYVLYPTVFAVVIAILAAAAVAAVIESVVIQFLQ
ncbi:Protein of unknown function [Evansella caseinilytica]|uniref:DUF1360 domain-containing protein n=1 Tax=Evansella caseinilytica TaxID=1503961 RepID=A0A1H3PGA6_9BACI|nr:DUF1360 domain-containing protein [Evansella caseinilytica]SDY99983.1 Protein of unknown function [Evansella caseinilytica]